MFSIEEPTEKARDKELVWSFNSGGQFRLWVISPHLLVLTLIGRGDGTPVPMFEKAAGPPPLDGKKQNVFVDVWLLDGYEPALRTTMTAWVNKRRAHLAKVHCLFRSKVVAMGVSVAALAVGGGIFASHSTRASFNAAFAAVQGG